MKVTDTTPRNGTLPEAETEIAGKPRKNPDEEAESEHGALSRQFSSLVDSSGELEQSPRGLLAGHSQKQASTPSSPLAFSAAGGEEESGQTAPKAGQTEIVASEMRPESEMPGPLMEEKASPEEDGKPPVAEDGTLGADLEKMSSFSIRLPGETPEVRGKQEPAPLQEAIERVQDVVDRILVSHSKLSDKQEVRITLKDSFLEGTEIRIAKDDAGIRITVVSNSRESYELLVQQSDSMSTSLQENLDVEVHVEVQYAETGQQQDQGRSRQRRSVIDERDE